MKRLLLVAAAAVLLVLAGSASAGTIDDLRALGYTVTITSPGPTGQNCPTYYISGHSLGVYANCNTPQSDIDSWANPAAICNADWQHDHRDQFDAVTRIRQAGWSISGDQCADRYIVSNPYTGERVYNGGGAGLVSLDPGVPAQAGTEAAAATGSSGPGGGQCLPLCPAQPDPATPAGTVDEAPEPTVVVVSTSPDGAVTTYNTASGSFTVTATDGRIRYRSARAV